MYAILLNLLDRIHAIILQEKLNLAGKGTTPSVSDVKYHDFWKKLHGLDVQLARIKQKLDSAGHLLDLRRQLAWNLPPGLRYREKQSIGDTDAVRQQVLARAAEVEQELRALMFGGQKPTKADLLKGIDKLAKEGESLLGKLDTQALSKHIGDGPEVGGPGVPAAPGASLSFLITLIMLYILRSKKPKDEGE
jgi:hypothetical protein